MTQDEDFKIFKSCEIVEEDFVLKVKAVFSDEFQEWLYYWLGEEIKEILTNDGVIDGG